MNDELKPCPFCGGTDIVISAFGIAPDCRVECKSCGAMIGKEVPWGKLNEKKHDKKCVKILTESWNRRIDNG